MKYESRVMYCVDLTEWVHYVKERWPNAVEVENYNAVEDCHGFHGGVVR